MYVYFFMFSLFFDCLLSILFVAIYRELRFSFVFARQVAARSCLSCSRSTSLAGYKRQQWRAPTYKLLLLPV